MSSAKRYLLIALSFILALTIFATFTPRIAHAIAATLVQIVNTAANPVPVQPVEAKQAVRLECSVAVPAGSYFYSCAATNMYTGTVYVVPGGKRLVVDFISSSGSSAAGQSVVEVFVQANNFEYLAFPVTSAFNIGGTPHYALANRTAFYADPGTGLAVYLQTNTSAGGAYGTIYLHGHLEDIQ